MIPKPVKVEEHAGMLASNPRYAELIAAVEAAGAALDDAYDKLIMEFPPEEDYVIYCIFGDKKCRLTHTTPNPNQP